jgi:sarcosine oxidase subunit beta
VAAGTTSAGEGNLLVSDKEAGPELDLALYSHAVWQGELAEFGGLWEFESKGGFVVASSAAGLQGLRELQGRQRAAGIATTDVPAGEIPDYEPALRDGLAGAAYYPQDAQVQPMLLAAHLLRLARAAGATVATGTEVTGITLARGRVAGVRTTRGDVACGHVVNAAGTWASAVAALAGVDVPVLPRRGFILVTEPLPPTVRHKVYAGEYVASTQSSDEGLQTSSVVEGTRAGTVLIGASRERVGFDPTVSLPALSRLAAEAAWLFPVLADVRVLRTYLGFRPYSPDHLPSLGEDARVPGLWHACGHEGAGIGLSAGSAKLLAQAVAGRSPDLDLTPFAPHRFENGDVDARQHA